MSLWDAMGKFNIGVKNNIFGHTAGSLRTQLYPLDYLHTKLLSLHQSDKYVHICWFAPEVGRSAAEHILGTLLVVDGYTGKGKNKHECTRIEGSERNSDDST
jgi:hypothetical protein